MKRSPKKKTKKIAQQKTFLEWKKKFNGKYTDIQLVNGSEVKNFKALPTGFPTVDYNNLGIGGLPIGGTVMIHGKPTVGKTSFYLGTIRYHTVELKNKHFRACIIDMEHALIKSHIDLYSIPAKQIEIIRPVNGEDCLNQFGDILESGFFDLIILDSVAKLISKKEMELDIGQDAKMASVATLMKQFMNKYANSIRESNSAIILINQERTWPDGMGRPVTRLPGGVVYLYQLTARLELKKQCRLTDDNNEIYGKKIQVRTHKSKAGGSHEDIDTYLIQHHSKGYMSIYSHFEFLTERGIIEQAGAWYKFAEKEIWPKSFYMKDFAQIFQDTKHKLKKFYQVDETVDVDPIIQSEFGEKDFEDEEMPSFDENAE